jgi:hypothetical protein
MAGVGIDRVPEWVEPAALEVVEAARVAAGFYRDMPERHREGGAAAALWWVLGMGSAPLTGRAGEATPPVVLAEAGAGDRVLYRVFGRSVLALMMLGLDDCEPMANVTVGGETVPIGTPLVQDTAWAEGVVAACMWLLGYAPEPPVMLPARPPPTAEQWFRIELAQADEATRRDPAAVEALWRDAETMVDFNRQVTAYADGTA